SMRSRLPPRSRPMTTTFASPPAVHTVVADLVLARMSLPSKNPVSPKIVREDVGKLLGTELSTDDFNELRNELASSGFLTKGKRNTFVMTEAGRERAMRFLGTNDLPPRMNWSTLIARYLFPRAAGLSEDAAAKLKSGDNVAALILKRKYDLPAGAG